MTGDGVVHIVDDDAAVRQSLAFMLSAAGHAVRVYESPSAFLDGLKAAQTGCLVTDVRMPEMTGLELLRRLRDKGCLIPAIVITGHGDVPLAVEAMKAGAIDFIEKPFEDQVLVNAIKRAADRLDKPEAVDDAATLRARLDHLSERERQVLSAVVAGMPNKTIAYDLNISPRTVEVHRANVMAKMQARSLPDLVRMAIALNLAERRG